MGNRRIESGLIFIVLVMGFALTTGCTAKRVPKSFQPPAAPHLLETTEVYKKEYILHAGDQIEVAVRKVPEVSRTVTIRPDGFITLPLFNDIKAGGSTVSELRASLTDIMSKRLVEPEVTVIATVVQPPSIYVFGEVNTPSPIPLRTARTAMEAVAAAGGLRKTASVRDICIIRLSEDGHLQIRMINNDIKGQPGPFFGLHEAVLQADDIIFVPENNRSQFNRTVNDFITQPLYPINQLLSIYLNFKIISQYH